ncbi:MAG TPA: AN1-type zinc finger domain-containing protein [Methanospirillum sp.]|nr:AN1-type zinc finger domain-containing protein [Methanospirillum sp.]
MVECEVCGVEIRGGSAFTCSYCKKNFCPDHRLPFNHACSHIEEWRMSARKKRDTPPRQNRTIITPRDSKRIVATGVIGLFILMMVLWLFRII